VAVLPVAAVGRNLADVDLGIEVRRERVAVVAGIAVEDVDVVDLVEVVLEAAKTPVTPGSKPEPKSAVMPAFS